MTIKVDRATLMASRLLPLTALRGIGCEDGAIVPADAVTISSHPNHPANSVLKRTLDVVLATCLLLVLMPLLLTIAAIIRSESRGPALFRQRRGGLNGVTFRIYKFRTMRVQDDGDSVSHATRADQRVTRFGALLRKTSFDEFPQLINIIKGEMSLVGPRPHAAAHDAFYGASVQQYADRMRVRPGLTGLAQVSGHRGEVLDLNAMKTRVNYDLKYIENWSLVLDVKLIVLTAFRLPFDRRAY